jgi:hypothetical protein
MDMSALSSAEFGNVESLNAMLFENGMQHQLFRDTVFRLGQSVPAYPLMEADVDNLDDWLIAHQDEHQAYASLLGLNNPFNLLDVDWNDQDQFYDWISSHLFIHETIASALGVVK